MNYKEKIDKSKKFKENYVKGLSDIIEKRQEESEKIREKYAKDIFENPEKYRNEFKKMLGWPLVDFDSGKDIPNTSSEKLSDENGYSIYRMQFEIIDGLEMTGLLFKADSEQKKPLVIVQHGGQGTPELVSGFYGDTANYNDFVGRILKHGVSVFAPQLLLWSDEYGVDFDRVNIDARLKRVGSSVTAVEVYGLTRIIDYFEKQSFVFSIGMVGLSYGGFYTLYTAAVDKRIKSAISCSFFNTRDAYGFSDWTWFDSARKFDDAEVAALICPRRLCIEIGTRDELFDCASAEKAFEKLEKMKKSVPVKWDVELIEFDGTHEFCKDDKPIIDMIAELCG